jgi:hypothetical protein
MSSSGFCIGPADGVGIGVGTGVESTDGPLMEFGVGVGVDFVRPDCAYKLPDKNAESKRNRCIERSDTS